MTDNPKTEFIQNGDNNTMIGYVENLSITNVSSVSHEDVTDDGKPKHFGDRTISLDDYQLLCAFRNDYDELILECVRTDYTVPGIRIDLADDIDSLYQNTWDVKSLKITDNVIRRLIFSILECLNNLMGYLSDKYMRSIETSRGFVLIARNESWEEGEQLREDLRPGTMKLRYQLRDLYRELHPEDYRDVPPFEDSYERYCKENGINLKSEEMIMTEHDKKYYRSLIDELRKLPKETEWAEFKVNNFAPNEIGEYLSTLSNSGALHEKETAYLLYGVHDETHEIVGTKFNPKEAKVGNEELENWLLTQLTPRIDFKFVEVDTEKGPVVVVEIPVARIQPTAFKGVEYIRVGSYSKKLKDFPEKERKLWRMFEIRPFETMSAKENVDSETITRMLDTGAFYTLMSLPVPSTRDGIIHDFSEYGFIKRMDNGNYSITNMGALLFAKDIRDFIYLENKRIRVIRYKGSGRTNAIRDQFFYKGYAVGFDDIVNYIMSMLPQEETIETARREEFIMFPEKAVREMLGNLMIHQDMTARGQSLMVEIFDERIEATNPGSLLVDVDRIIDTAPHARNEKMADFLRLVHICEVRGSGFDRMEEGMRDWKIPAPKVETGEDFCRTMFFWHESLSKWSKEDKTRTCYLYVCYCYVNGIEVSNAVLRDRFGITEANKAMASRIIKDTVETGKIKLKDPNAAVKMRRYVPYWA